MADIKKALSMIGLSKKAGKLVSGVPIVCDALRDGKVCLVVYASRAAENSVKRVTDKATTYKTAAFSIDVSPEELGHSIGKVGAVAAVGITDNGFAEAIKKIISD
ncbi:MAG: ribosomal L7Ae/L30e/S12e/Gadd45 family protein [Oscillospiraceae bacterium]|nr:ribosomal L7Ae/L30e/S12e/Gadd45 family protein [Clostridia bacterium]MBQ9857940.1 ribosomal L7Ae/L30e/S12e/Gadd45 family protein [Oscillospiraceae bacterium]